MLLNSVHYYEHVKHACTSYSIVHYTISNWWIKKSIFDHMRFGKWTENIQLRYKIHLIYPKPIQYFIKITSCVFIMIVENWVCANVW